MLWPMRCHGFTLIELCFTLLIAGVLACWAVPSFAALWRNAALDHESAALLTALQYARAQSIALGEPVVLCQTEDLHQCLSGAARARGWLVFADRQRGSPVQVNAGDEVLQVHALPAPLFLGGSRLALSYWPATLAGTTGTLTLCDDRGAVDAHAVIVSQTGRPRMSKVAADGSALVCAA